MPIKLFAFFLSIFFSSTCFSAAILKHYTWNNKENIPFCWYNVLSSYGADLEKYSPLLELMKKTAENQFSKAGLKITGWGRCNPLDGFGNSMRMSILNSDNPIVQHGGVAFDVGTRRGQKYWENKFEALGSTFGADILVGLQPDIEKLHNSGFAQPDLNKLYQSFFECEYGVKNKKDCRSRQITIKNPTTKESITISRAAIKTQLFTFLHEMAHGLGMQHEHGRTNGCSTEKVRSCLKRNFGNNADTVNTCTPHSEDKEIHITVPTNRIDLQSISSYCADFEKPHLSKYDILALKEAYP